MVEAAATQAQSLADLLNQRSPGERTAAQLTKTKHARASATPASATAPAERLTALTPKLAKIDLSPIELLLDSPATTDNDVPPLTQLAGGSPPTIGGIVGSLPGIGGGGGGGGGGGIGGGSDMGGGPGGGGGGIIGGGGGGGAPGGGDTPGGGTPGGGGTNSGGDTPGGGTPGGGGTTGGGTNGGGTGGGGVGGGGGTEGFPSEKGEAVVPTSAVPEPATWAMMLLGFGLVGWRLRARPKPVLNRQS